MVSGYTMITDPDTSAKAVGKEIPVSPKFSREVCGMIRGMKVEKAMQQLEEVIELTRPVPLKRYNKRVSHKAGVGPGRYPKKAAKAILGVIQSAASNAEYKGLDVSNMAITTISISRGRTIPGHMPRAHGRATQWNQETVNVEVIIQEVE
jgi:large subunit ribosomal protein L22